MFPNFSCLASIRRLHPLIHCISNLVTANDCANLAYALGASPIMAHAPQEAETITAAAFSWLLSSILGTEFLGFSGIEDWACS